MQIRRTFFKHFIVNTTIAMSLGVAGTAFSATDLYSLTSALAPSQDSSEARIRLNVTSKSALESAGTFNIWMPTGGNETGKVTRTLKTDASFTRTNTTEESITIISLENQRGSLKVTSSNDQISSILFYDNIERRYFRADIEGDEGGYFKEENLEKYQCPVLPTDQNILFSMPKTEGLVPDLSDLKNLESKPDASNTLYLNYWGGTLTDTAWNDSSNGGDPIDYAPYDTDDNDATFSDNERYLMWLAWQETAEDYASFDINVTTRQSVYDSTPSTNRSQIIATPTNVVAPGSGGVAYVGIFGRSDDYYNTGWTFNDSATSMGMTHSHEAGHQMGLNHDDTSSRGYYSGHGNWGPIMGAPFGKSFVQWSKGEYPDAQNDEDDLTIVSEVLGVSADDAGGTTATAIPLSIPNTDLEGHIRPDGISPDTDVYSLTLASSATVSLEIVPLLGDEAEDRAANLAMNVSLKDSDDNDIASMTSSDDLPLNPATNKLVYNGALAAGTYYVSVTGGSPDQNWSTGFGEYGNEGLYRLKMKAIIDPVSSDDFYVSDSRLSSATVLAGKSVTAYTTQAYAGDKLINQLKPYPYVGYYLSEDELFDSNDQLLGQDPSSLGSNDRDDPESARLNIPSSTPGGDYYILFVSDYKASYAEQDEKNNIEARPLTITALVSDDFYVANSRLSSGTVQVGKFLRAYTTQFYTGNKLRNKLKPYPYVGYYLSTDNQLDSDDQLLGEDVSSLGSNDQNDPESARLVIPASTPDGSYYILFVADYKNSHDEDNESNNLEFVEITVHQ